MAEKGSKLEGHKDLTSIKGIGKITGAILLSVIGDVNDFRTKGDWRATSGLCRACPTPIRRNALGEFTSVGRSWGGRRWCNRR